MTCNRLISTTQQIALKPAFLNICCFTMANFHVQKLIALLVKFEMNISHYARNPRASAPDVSRNIQSIHSWVEDERRNAERQPKENKSAKVGKSLKHVLIAWKSRSSENQALVMKGCLKIATSVAVVVGGPYGAATVATCDMLSSIISASSSKESDLVTVFTDKFNEELLKFNEELKRQTFEGLKSRVKNMNAYLKELEALSNTELPDKVLFETDFPQFIGEVAYNFLKGLDENRKEEVNNCLTSMAIYCNVQTALLLLLTNILATFR